MPKVLELPRSMDPCVSIFIQTATRIKLITNSQYTQTGFSCLLVLHLLAHITTPNLTRSTNHTRLIFFQSQSIITRRSSYMIRTHQMASRAIFLPHPSHRFICLYIQEHTPNALLFNLKLKLK